MKLYYHKTDGGAEYLMDTYIKWEHNGKKGKEGTINDKTKYVVRIDGNIETDAELRIIKTIDMQTAIKKAKKWIKEIEKEGLNMRGTPPLTYEEEAYVLLTYFINY